MNLVVDASVAVKWLIQDSEREQHVDRALALLHEVMAGRVFLFQPPHWLLEVAAVVTRLDPDLAEPALDLLDAMEIKVVGDLPVLKRASRIAHELNHHLFDTLYHALAIEYEIPLVSADDRYCRKARHLGHLLTLDSWQPSTAR